MVMGDETIIIFLHLRIDKLCSRASHNRLESWWKPRQTDPLGSERCAAAPRVARQPIRL